MNVETAIAPAWIPPTPGVEYLAAPYVVIDIETGNPPDEAIEQAMADWKPPANVKDEAKIEARRQEAAERIAERGALLDAAPIICAGLKTPTASILLNGMDAEEYSIEGWNVFSVSDERALLFALREWLNVQTTPDTSMVGHSIIGFDRPKLRARFMAHRLRLPAILAPGAENPIFDTMKQYSRFSVECRDQRFISLDRVCAGLDIPRPKQVISGADVPRLHACGEVEPILLYNAVDVAATERAYLLMTSSAADMD